MLRADRPDQVRLGSRLTTAETNNDSIYDQSLYINDEFSFIKWRRESGNLKYILTK
jgi:hypothetical protein